MVFPRYRYAALHLRRRNCCAELYAKIKLAAKKLEEQEDRGKIIAESRCGYLFISFLARLCARAFHRIREESRRDGQSTATTNSAGFSSSARRSQAHAGSRIKTRDRGQRSDRRPVMARVRNFHKAGSRNVESLVSGHVQSHYGTVIFIVVLWPTKRLEFLGARPEVFRDQRSK